MPPAESALTPATITAALHERDRLREIAALRLTDDDVQPLLDDLCAEATRLLDIPTGVVTIVLDEAQHFAAQHGLGGWFEAAGGTPSEWAFCRVPVTTHEPFVVTDASEHGLLRENPLVTQDGLRCYAGIPLVTSRGFAVGSFCVLGPESRQFTDADLAALQRLAANAVERLEARRAQEAR